MPKSKNRNHSAQTSISRVPITAESPLRVVFQQLVEFANQKSLNDYIGTARERFLIMTFLQGRPLSETLRRVFWEWAIFDYRERRNKPTLLERFIVSRNFDEATAQALAALGQGRNSFFRVLEIVPDKDESKLTVVELGKETEGRFEAPVPSDLGFEQQEVLEGRLVPWRGGFRFIGGLRRMDAEFMKEIEGDLRSLRIKHADSENWVALVCYLKPLLFQAIESNRDIVGLIKNIATGEIITPDRVFARYAIARLEAGDGARALQWSEEARQDFPDSDVIRSVLAQCLDTNDRADEALELLKESIQIRETDLRLRLQAANVLMRRQRFSEARGIMEPALELKADRLYPDIISAMGMCFYREGECDRGRALMRESIAEKPENTFIYISNAITLLDGEEYQEALDHVEQALEINAEETTALLLQGRCFEGLGRDAEALAIYDRVARRIQPSPDFLKRTAAVAARLGRCTRAASAYECCLQTDPHDIEAACGLIRVLRQRGRDHQAVPILERLLAQHPNHPELLKLLEETGAPSTQPPSAGTSS